MVSEHKLEVNQNFELVVRDSSFQGNYLSKIADISGGRIKVTAPFVHGEVVPLRINMGVEMYFTAEMAAYAYKTKIVDREMGEIPLLVLTYPDLKQRIQRREFFRLEVKEKVYYRLLDRELQAITELKETTTIDISGGGVKMVFDNVKDSNNDIHKGRLMELFLQIPELGDTAIISKVVNVFDLPEGIAVGIKFVEIDNYVREKIISWLFDYQRELRQRGML
ncbi:MAG: hypothetical protein FH762_02230 [Firmicutes bacterium]|nr:hypothetical protein [Bacillota bacterium]